MRMTRMNMKMTVILMTKMMTTTLISKVLESPVFSIFPRMHCPNMCKFKRLIFPQVPKNLLKRVKNLIRVCRSGQKQFHYFPMAASSFIGRLLLSVHWSIMTMMMKIIMAIMMTETMDIWDVGMLHHMIIVAFAWFFASVVFIAISSDFCGVKKWVDGQGR